MGVRVDDQLEYKIEEIVKMAQDVIRKELKRVA